MTEEQQSMLETELVEIGKVSAELLDFFGIDESKSIEKLNYMIEPDTLDECLERYYAALESAKEEEGTCIVLQQLHEDEYNEQFGRGYYDDVFDLKMALAEATYGRIESVIEECDEDDYL